MKPKTKPPPKQPKATLQVLLTLSVSIQELRLRASYKDEARILAAALQ